MFIFFRWLFKNIPPDKETETLVRRAAASAYGVFINPDFRRLVNWSAQSEQEQDRIFNELLVTGIALLDLIIDAKLPDIKPGRQHFWRGVKGKVPESFCDWLAGLGIAGQFVDMWKKLIDMRVKEYFDEQKQTRAAWAREFKDHPDKSILTEAAARLETVVVGSMLHITRGKASTAADDPLRRHLRTWISVLDHRLNERVGW